MVAPSAVTRLAYVGIAVSIVGSVTVRSSAAGLVAAEGTQPGGLSTATAPADIESKCKSCHGGGVDDDGVTFRPWDTWSATMMANATRDPLFLAALTVAEQDATGIGTYCLRCHTPKGFVNGHATGVGAALDANDNQGVDCEGCHRSINGSMAQAAVDHAGTTIAALAAVDPNAPYIGNARLLWDPRDVRHGPYSDAESPAHAALANAFQSSAELCGQCHEVASPAHNLVDASGNDTGFPFPLDTTYTEWKSSDYAAAAPAPVDGGPPGAQSCIDCHMPKAHGDSLTVSTYPSAMRRSSPRMHLFVGGNEWGLDAVQLADPTIATDRAAAFDAAKQAVQAVLARAVQIDVAPATASAGATSLDLTVRVTNLAGHKFPTGYADGRRAFLQVELLDATNTSLALVGKYDDATQKIAVDPQVRVWEAVQAARGGDGGYQEWHIANNDTVLKDTRIPPKGFHPTGAAAIATTAPVGADYGPATGMRNYDDVSVHFASLAPLAEATQLRVVARVFYQSTTREFIEELARANATDQRGTALQTIWEQTGRAAPRLIQTSTADVTVGPAPRDGGADSSASTGATGGTTAGDGGTTGGTTGTTSGTSTGATSGSTSSATSGATTSSPATTSACSCGVGPRPKRLAPWLDGAMFIASSLWLARRRRWTRRSSSPSSAASGP